MHPARMALALDPALPLLWRSPTTVQIGLDRPAVVLTGVTTADERMLWALRLGISRSGLTMIAASAGGTDDDVVALLDAVSDALVPGPPSPRPVGRVVLEGDGPCAERLAPAIAAAGHTLVQRRSTAPTAEESIAPGAGAADAGAAGEPPAHTVNTAEADLAVVVARYAVRPAVYGYWARRDIPLLAVVFSDRWVQVGPLVVPDVGPCLHCVDRHRTDADAAWPALASQLAGRPAPTESSPLTLLEASALAAPGGGRVARRGQEPARRLLTAARRPDRTPQPARVAAAPGVRLSSSARKRDGARVAERCGPAALQDSRSSRRARVIPT